MTIGTHFAIAVSNISSMLYVYGDELRMTYICKGICNQNEILPNGYLLHGLNLIFFAGFKSSNVLTLGKSFHYLIYHVECCSWHKFNLSKVSAKDIDKFLFRNLKKMGNSGLITFQSSI